MVERVFITGLVTEEIYISRSCSVFFILINLKAGEIPSVNLVSYKKKKLLFSYFELKFIEFGWIRRERM